MNTKKITALALAALMAAGSTSTVFAAVDSSNKDKVLEFADSTGKTYYEENDDGLLVVDKDGVAPGESVYFLLKDGDGVSGIEDKDRDRIKVYADWKMGKDYIKDIDVIYDKGNSVVTGYSYTIKGTGTSLDGKVYTLTPTEHKTAVEGTGVPAAVWNKIKADTTSLEAALDQSKVPTGHYITDKATAKHYANTAEGIAAYLDENGWICLDKELQITESVGESGTYTTGTNHSLPVGAYTKLVTTTNYYVVPETMSTMAKLKTAFDSGNLNGMGVTSTTWAEATANDYVVDGEIKTKTDAENALKNLVKYDEVIDRDASSFTYWVKIDTKESFTTKEQDIAGTLYLGTSKNSAEKAKNEISIGLPLSNRIDDNNGSYVIKDGDTIYPDANGAVKFEDDAEEVTIYFGSNEDAWFTFNAAGQGALNLAYNTKFNREIADLFPKANIDFISWIAEPAANRTGDLYITAEEDTFLYQVTEDGKGIKEVKGADYDEDEGAWHIRTRKLGSYVISDMELDTTAKVEDKDDASSNSSTSSKPNGDKHNPDTGR